MSLFTAAEYQDRLLQETGCVLDVDFVPDGSDEWVYVTYQHALISRFSARVDLDNLEEYLPALLRERMALIKTLLSEQHSHRLSGFLSKCSQFPVLNDVLLNSEKESQTDAVDSLRSDTRALCEGIFSLDEFSVLKALALLSHN